MLGSHYTRDGEEGEAELSISEELFPKYLFVCFLYFYHLTIII